MIDRRALLTAAAALPLVAAGRPRAALRVATFNIWHDAGDWPTRLPLLVAALRETDPHAIFLQEVLQDAGKGLPNQAETIAAALGGGWDVEFASTSPVGARNRYGNAILTRLPVAETTMRKLEPADDYRTALRVRVRTGGRAVDLVTTHLAWQPDAGPVRARQIADLLAWLPRDRIPLVLGGDFNAPADAPELTPLRARGLTEASPPAARTTLAPGHGYAEQVIDHIFTDPRTFAVAGARIIGDRPTGGVYPSDHFGVAATLRRR